MRGGNVGEISKTGTVLDFNLSLFSKTLHRFS